jgi:hypothetical protein
LDQVGVQTDNANTIVENFSYELCVVMMFIDAIIYGVLAWYFDKVLPSEFGTPLPLYFPFLPSYWFGTNCSGVAMNTADYKLLKDRVEGGDVSAHDVDAGKDSSIKQEEVSS